MKGGGSLCRNRERSRIDPTGPIFSAGAQPEKPPDLLLSYFFATFGLFFGVPSCNVAAPEAILDLGGVQARS